MMDISLPVIFLAGLGTFLTPCVLPLIPIYLGSLAGSTMEEAEKSVAGRLRIIKGALYFVAGFTVVFVALGLASSLVGKTLAAHRVLLIQIGGLLVFLFGLKFLGVLKIDWLDRELRFEGPAAGSAWRNLAFGFVFALGWTPCIGPVLGSVLTYTASTTSDPLKGGLYLLAYAAGFAVPLLAVAVALSAARKLIDRLKKHMRKVEVIGGAALVMVGLLLIVGKLSWLTGSAAALPSGKANTAACEPKEKVASMVQFKSETCSICKSMEPVLAQLEQDCTGAGVRVRRVNLSVRTNRPLAVKHRVIGVPTFVFLDKEGKEVARLVGRQSLKTLRQHMSLLTGESCPDVGGVPGSEPVPARGSAQAGQTCDGTRAGEGTACNKW